MRSIPSTLSTAFCFAILSVALTAHAQLDYTTNWVGNTFPGNNGTYTLQHVTLDMQGIYVTPDGHVYTNTGWDEGGRAVAVFQNGQIAGPASGNAGGPAIAVSGSTIYASQNTGTGNNPPCAAGGCGVSLLSTSTLQSTGCLTGDANAGCNGSPYIYGMTVSNGNLYVAIDDQNTVDIFSTSSNALTQQFSISDPMHIAVDSQGGMWISHHNSAALPNVNGIIYDYFGDFGLATIDHYSSSGTYINTITLPDNGEVSALWIDSSNNLYVGDEGTDQNIKIYNNILSSPTLSKTFGVKGGVWSQNPPGLYAAGEFRFVSGIGTDSSGNIYVADDDFHHGVILSSFTSSGSLNWQVQGLEFVSFGTIDPYSQTDAYDPYRHYKLNYSNVPGNLGTLYSETYNPFQYSTDIRTTQSNIGTVQLQHVQGQKFMLISNQPGSGYQINKFVSGQEVTVPCTALDYGAFQEEYLDFVNQPTNGEFIWTDANGDGTIQSSEISQPSSSIEPLEHRDGQDFWMDTNGDIWQVNYYAPSENSIHLRRYLFQGFNSYGCPTYSFNNMDVYNESTDFAQLTDIDRVEFHPEDSPGGTLYAAGSNDGNGQFTQVARYDNWDQGNRTAAWVTTIPTSSSVTPISMSVAGDYFFIDYNTPHYISVYSTVNGAYVGEIDPGSNVGGDNNIGNDDEWTSTTATVLSNGNYLITKEEDYQAKVLMYIWTPSPVATPVATPTLSPAAGTYGSSQSVTISDSTSGATIYYTTNGKTPTTGSTKYTGPVSVSSSEVLEAIAVLSGDLNSLPAAAAYTINSQPTAATPTFSPAGGTYSSSQSVTISDSTSGATIYYTTNGTTPTTSSTKYTGAISVTSTETIEAIATASGYNNSAVASATYTISSGGGSGPVVEINAGGSAVSGTSWVADTDVSGGTGETWTNSINTSNVTNPAPTAVYQSDHFAYNVSSFTYTIPNLTANASYTVRLHFCENYWTAAGDRVFNVSINGTQVLTNFDVYKTAGGKAIANIQQFSATANSSGQIVIVFTTVTDNAMVSGIEIDGSSTPTAATPTFSPAAGTYTSAQSVTISDSTSGATIYYTTNGTTPTTSSTKYTGAISVSSTETIEAIATASGYNNSSVASATYTINLPQTATPTFSPAAGTYTSTQSVTISDSTSGATIYYTTNGTTPTTSSTKYTGAISVSSTETIEAIATASGYTTSAVGSATYTISTPQAATPTFSPAAGTYTSAQSVTISDGTSGATIYYTTNGTTPTTSSTKYIGAISVSSTETIEAIATASGYTTSAVGSATYTISSGGGSSPVAEINAGGPAVSGTSWVADTDVSGGTGETWTNSINTSNVTNPAPTAVYQSDHFAYNVSSFTYTIPNLTANASYTVRLHFCENYWTAAGDRVFNVSINGTQVLTNFDVYKTAGGKAIANIQQFSATANSSGQIAIVFTSVTDNAMVSGVEIDGGSQLTAVDEINAGGSAVSGTSWLADTDYSGGAGETWTNSINTSNVTNPAPTAVYQSDHFAYNVSSFTYTIAGLTANASYTVRLHFCENFWTASGQRVFNVSINGTQVLSNFDVFKTAGGQSIANIQQFTTTANSSGQIAIVFTSVTDNAMVSGIEIDH